MVANTSAQTNAESFMSLTQKSPALTQNEIKATLQIIQKNGGCKGVVCSHCPLRDGKCMAYNTNMDFQHPGIATETDRLNKLAHLMCESGV